MKINNFLLVCICLFSMQSFAQLTLGAELRPRSEFRNGYKTLNPDNVDAALFISQRTRLNTNFQKEKYTVFVSIQDVRVWGDVKQLNVSDKNGLTLHQAWGLVNFKNLKLKVGRQEIAYDDHRMFGNVGWAQQARSHDAFLLKTWKDNFKFDVGLAFNQDAENLFGHTYTTAGNYKAMQYLWFHNQWNALTASLLFLNNGLQYIDIIDPDKDEIRYSQTIGTHLKYKFSETVNATGNFYYQTGSDIVNFDINAFLVGLDVYIKATDNLNLGAGFEMQSGNDYDASGVENKAFSPFYGTNHKFNGFMDYFYVGNHFNSAGLTDIYAKISAKLNEKSNLTLFIHNFNAYAEVGADVSKQLGTELDIVLSHAIKKDISISAGYSQMFASEGMEVLKNNFDGNSNNWAWLMLTIKPSFLIK